MGASARETIEGCFRASKEGALHFGEVVRRLSGAGVESYFADFRAGRTTYYLADGQSLPLEGMPGDTEVADAFDAPAVTGAIRAAQRDDIRYPEFVRRTRAAGCVGYFVWLAGRHARYLGRRGETHVEHFPEP